jgi:cold shock CspA family protein
MELVSSENQNSVGQTLIIFGKIKSLNIDWGFIEGSNGLDYFLHCKSMNKSSCAFRSLKVGDKVEFEHTMNNKGPRAENCKRIK